MGMGHVPQDAVRAEGAGADVQGRQRGGTARRGAVGPDLAARARGQWAEDLAARWYQHHGYQVLDRNWRSPRGELDLVVTDGSTVVFVEVKARRTVAYGAPSEAVGPAKLRRVRATAAAWLAAHPGGRAHALRFDVAAVTGTRLELIHDVGSPA